MNEAKKKGVESFLYTKATTNRDGDFKTALPLKRGQSYSVIIEATNFQPKEVDEGVEIGDGGESILVVGSVELQKKK